LGGNVGAGFNAFDGKKARWKSGENPEETGK